MKRRTHELFDEFGLSPIARIASMKWIKLALSSTSDDQVHTKPKSEVLLKWKADEQFTVTFCSVLTNESLDDAVMLIV